MKCYALQVVIESCHGGSALFFIFVVLNVFLNAKSTIYALY